MSGVDGSGGIRPRPLLWLAAGCACVLLAALGLEYHSSVKRETRLAHSLSAPAAVASAAGAGAAIRPGPAAPAADLVRDWSGTALARPLFSRQRRPAATAVAGPRQPRLAGIVIGPSGARAIFAGDGSARGTVAGVGQQAGDWKVLAIAADGVQVTGPGGSRTLRPSRDPNGSQVADTPPQHPSILDLLRSRTLNAGPPVPQYNGSPFVFGGAPR